MSNLVQEKIMPAMTSFANSRYVKAIQQGMMGMVGVTIFGGIATLLKNPPITAGTTGGIGGAILSFAAANQPWLEVVYQCTTNLFGILAVIGIISALCRSYQKDPLNPIIMGLACFLILSVNLVEYSTGYSVGYHFDISFLGAQGIFTAIVTGILVVELSRFIENKNIKIKLPESVPPFVAQPFEALISNFIVICVFIALRLICGAMGFMFPQIIAKILSPILMASENIFVVILLFALSRVLWFFGVHGTSVILAVLMPIMAMNSVENLAAYNAGAEIPHVLTSSFLTWQIGMLPAAIAMLLVCRSAQLKATARLGIVPSLFMISEPILFGTPFVFNPILFVPHIAAFAWTVGAAYFAMSAGWVTKPIFGTPGQLPGFIAAYLQTFDWKAVVLWFFVVAVAVLIYIPFLKKYDKQLLEQEKAGAAQEG